MIAAIVSTLVMMAMVPAPAIAADVGIHTKRVVRSAAPEVLYSPCGSVWKCGPSGCAWYRACWRRCPDRYSCSPLYGAYGPYGGVAYWSAYSGSWGYYR
jgi:hypothetical protein